MGAVRTDQGEGAFTAYKETSLKAIVSLHMNIAECIINKQRGRSYLYIDCNAGSGYNHEADCEGSPLVFLDAVACHSFDWRAYFIDNDKAKIGELRMRMGLDDRVELRDADNGELVPELLAAARPWQAFGIVYHDPNGIPNLNIFKQMPPKSTIDVLIRYNGNGVKRAGGGRLTESLKAIPKQYWYIQKVQPGDKWQWAFLLGTNWDKFPEYRKHDFVRLDSADGKAQVELLDYTREELRNKSQPTLIEYSSYEEYRKLPQFKAVRREAFNRAAGRCERCGSAATEAHHLRYPAWGTLDVPENMIALCHRCHCDAHGKDN